MLIEPGRDEPHHRAEDQAAPDTGTHALCQEKLPVAVGERGHEDTKELQDGAGVEHRPIVSSIQGASGQGAEEKSQEEL